MTRGSFLGNNKVRGGGKASKPSITTMKGGKSAWGSEFNCH
jgi:hypothetical protein